MQLLSFSWLSPRYRILAILLCLGLLLIASTYAVLNLYIHPTFERYEYDLAATDLSRVEQAIDGQLDALTIINREYSEWDDMYQYVLAPESMPHFIDEEMYEEYWWPAGVELVLILDRDGQLTWGLLTEDGGGSSLTLDDVVLPLFTGHPLLSSPASVNSHIRGLVDTPVGLLMIVSAPITRDDGSGPVVGSFIVGRILSDEKIAQIAKSTDASVTMFFLADPELSDRVRDVPLELDARGKNFLARSSGNQLYMLSQLRDLYGDPVAVVQTSTDRRIDSIGADSVKTALIYLSLIIAGLIFISWLLLVACLPTDRQK